MSTQDKQLLDMAGLSAAKVAGMLHKSRQAVSRGVRGDADYFTEADMLLISDHMGQISPSQQRRLQDAIGALFGGVAERLRAQTASRDLRQAIAEAERAWLVFPDFILSRQIRADAYQTVLDCLAERKPPTGFDNKAKRFEVIAFCGSFEDRAAIEGEFDGDWFRRKRFAAIESDLVSALPPIIVVDPHRTDNCLCYVLSATGFVELGSVEAERWARSFSAATSRRYRPARAATALDGEKPFNMLVADVPGLLAAEARVIQADTEAAA